MKQARRARKRFFNKAIFTFLGLFLVFEAMRFLDRKGTITVSKNIVETIDFIMVSALTLLLINVVLRLTVERVFGFFKDELEIEQRIFVTKLYTVLVYGVGISFILYQSGVRVGEITLFLGLITTGIAFAIRDIILSFFAWLIILTKKPFRIGDVVSTGDDVGEVKRIGTFFVTLQSAEGFQPKIPNKNFLDKNTRNHGRGIIESEIRLPVRNHRNLKREEMKGIRQELLGRVKGEVNLASDGKDIFLSIRYRARLNSEASLRTSIIMDALEKYPALFEAKDD